MEKNTRSKRPQLTPFILGFLGSPDFREGLEVAHDLIHAIQIFDEIGIDVMPLIAEKLGTVLEKFPLTSAALSDPSDPIDAEFSDDDKAPKKKSTLTPAGRKRLSRKLKASWARKRKEKAAAAKVAAKAGR